MLEFAELYMDKLQMMNYVDELLCEMDPSLEGITTSDDHVRKLSQMKSVVPATNKPRIQM